MRVTYMISLNHDVPAQSITKLHAYKFAANPRNPAQTRTFPRNATRKFGLDNPTRKGPRSRALCEKIPTRSASVDREGVCAPLDAAAKVDHVPSVGPGGSDVGPQHPCGASLFSGA